MEITGRHLNPGQSPQKLTVERKQSPALFALRAFDEQGVLAPISNPSGVLPEPPVDDHDNQESDVNGFQESDPLPEPRIEKGQDIGCGC